MLLLVALAAAGLARAQDGQGADELIARCSEQASIEAVGLVALEAQCPGLEAALAESGHAAFISESQLDLLTTQGLGDLRRLAQRYREPRSASNELEPAQLDSILSTLQQEQPPSHPLGWYGRLKQWLRNVLQQADEQSDSWLSRWLDDLEMTPSVRNGITYGAVVLVILLAVAVLVNELRAAGVLRGRRRRQAKLAEQSAVLIRDPHTMTLADLDALPLREQPSMLLRMVAAQLMKAGRLRSERSLTHRELAVAAAFEVETERASFGRMAGLAEKLRYGQRRVADTDIEAVMRDGRALSARLGAEAGSGA